MATAKQMTAREVCELKFPWDTREECEESIDCSHQTGRVFAYKCPECGKWHKSKLPQNKK